MEHLGIVVLTFLKSVLFQAKPISLLLTITNYNSWQDFKLPCSFYLRKHNAVSCLVPFSITKCKVSLLDSLHVGKL